jgi:hypothetical protein
MEFENLKNVLGEAYHEGITAEEVNNFFAGKSFADLSTGQYVDKNKYERDIQTLNTTITEKQNALNAKLTDDEKRQAAANADKAEIARLQKLLQENSINSNKDLAIGTMSSVKSLLELKDDDNEYNTFIDTIVSEDRGKTNSIATYISKITKDAYEKGKKDATKDAMGEFGKDAKGGNSSKKETNLGAELAKNSMKKPQSVDYFARK